jgi:hypothetical protein
MAKGWDRSEWRRRSVGTKSEPVSEGDNDTSDDGGDNKEKENNDGGDNGEWPACNGGGGGMKTVRERERENNYSNEKMKVISFWRRK